MIQTRRNRARFAAVLALTVAAAAAGWVLLRSDTFTLHAHFVHAGGLVKGGEVRVAGNKVGSIDHIGLTPNGIADVTLAIDREAAADLREGTRATIRAVGQATITNNFVDLSPGPRRAPALEEGSALTTDQTRGIVNIDALFSSFGPAERRRLRQLVARSAELYAGSGSRYFNAMLEELDPSLEQLNGLMAELNQDRGALERLIATNADMNEAIGSRDDDLEAAVGHMATTFGAIASERRSLSQLLGRAAPVLGQARGTLRRAEVSVTALRPMLREVPPTARPLREFLTRLTPTQRAARPVIEQLTRQQPALRDTLAALPPLERVAVPALRTLRKAAADSHHIFRALRIYGPDFILGVFNGLAGLATGNFNGYGQYARLAYVQTERATLAGRAHPLLNTEGLDLGLFDLKTRQTRRCPGGNTPPAPDGSSPWLVDLSLCDPSQTPPHSINQP